MEYLIIFCLVQSTVAIALTLSMHSDKHLVREALKHALEATIAIRALKQSTHSVIPVGPDSSVMDFERKIKEITGINPAAQTNGLDEDLRAAGMQDDIEDLV